MQRFGQVTCAACESMIDYYQAIFAGVHRVMTDDHVSVLNPTIRYTPAENYNLTFTVAQKEGIHSGDASAVLLFDVNRFLAYALHTVSDFHRLLMVDRFQTPL